jgi:hypothetical protein
MDQPNRTDFGPVLELGRRFLDAGNVNAYWELMARHDPYAELAGDIAAGRGVFAVIARGHLQRSAHNRLGRDLDDAENQELKLKIAIGDLKAREFNVLEKGEIRINSTQADVYHGKALEFVGLDPDAYTPHALQKVSAGFWSYAAGTPTRDVSGDNFWDAYIEHKVNDLEGFFSEPTDYLWNLLDAARTLGGITKDAASHFSESLDAAFFQWLDSIDPKLRRDPPLPPDHPDERIGGGGGNDPLGAPDADRARRFMDFVSEPERFRQANPLPVPSPWHDPVTGHIVGPPFAPVSRSFTKNEIAFKRLFAADIDVMQRMAMENAVRRRDDAEFKRRRTADDVDLGGAMRGVGETILGAAAAHSGMDTPIRALQGGLNQLTHGGGNPPATATGPGAKPLVVDGFFGPMTRDRLEGLLKGFGASPMEDALRRALEPPGGEPQAGAPLPRPPGL